MTENQIKGILSNWDIIEAEIRTGIHDDIGKSKDIQDIIDVIHDLQNTANTVSPIRELLNNHLNNLANPHDITITLSELDLLNTLYNLYIAQYGITMTITEFGFALINIKRFATQDDVDNGTHGDSLVNLDTVDYLINRHNTSPDAHAELFRQRLPGAPLTALPSEVFEPGVMIDGDFVVERNCTMTYHDINGRVRTTDINTISVDYAFGLPGVPIFGPHSNILLNSRALTNVSIQGAVRNTSSDLFIITPTDDTNFMLLQESETAGHHGFIDTLPETISGINDYCIYVYPLDRSRLAISILINDTEVLETAVYDCNTVDTMLSNNMDKSYAFIHELPNGWFRLALSFDAEEYNITGFKVSMLNTIDAGDPFNLDYQGEVCEAMGFWQHQLTDTILPVPPIFTTDTEVSVLGTKIHREFSDIFNPIHGSIITQYISPMSELFRTQNAAIRIGNNDIPLKTALTIGTDPISPICNRIVTYNMDDDVLETTDSDPYDPVNPILIKRVAFTYGLGYQGYGFTDQRPVVFRTSSAGILEQISTFFNYVFDGTGLYTGVRIIQMPSFIILDTDTDDNLIIGASANTSIYRLNDNVNVLELGYDSLTDNYLDGYLLNFKYYSVFSSEMNLEFLLDQYVPSNTPE